LDIARLGDMLARVKKRIVTRSLDRVSPLAVPALLEISREMVAAAVDEAILRDSEDALIRDAMRVD
jgi:ATP-dependent helicase Lhr and Lhr-like helicase